jgi:ferredoxin/coenzyme F420-reducing hydrogenase delta subunit
VARLVTNFLAPSRLDDRFFTLLIFLHIALPLFLLLCLWLHINRVSRPKINPPRGLALGLFATMIVLSLIKPAISHAPANLAQVPTVLSLDWYYLAIYPLMQAWSDGAVWGAVITMTLIVAVMPWMPAMRSTPAAVVDLANCNGCTRCEEDCPYSAITMLPRTDGRPFDRQPLVNPARCVSCGICTGACPTGTPFRRGSNLAPGIDMPHFTLRDLRERLHLLCAIDADEAPGPRILVFGCDYGVRQSQLADPRIRFISLPCIGMLSPTFIDYALSRKLADGVFLTGCRTGSCQNRLGQRWTEERLAGTRDPALRNRVDRDRLAWMWAAQTDAVKLGQEVIAFAEKVAALPVPSPATVPRLRSRDKIPDTCTVERVP